MSWFDIRERIHIFNWKTIHRLKWNYDFNYYNNAYNQQNIISGSINSSISIRIRIRIRIRSGSSSSSSSSSSRSIAVMWL